MVCQDPADRCGQVHVLEIDWRQVDRHTGDIEPGVTPLCHLPAGFTNRPQTDLLDQATLFGQRNEFRGRDLAEHRIVPTRQRFDAIDGAIEGANLRLIMQLQGIACERTAQRRAVGQPLLREPVHVGYRSGAARPGPG